ASGLHRPNGIALHKGTLYIAELKQISKIEAIEDKLDNPPKPTVILADLPSDEAHGWKYLTVGPDREALFPDRSTPATSACRPSATARSIASASTARASRSTRSASARSSAWTGTRP